MFVIGATSIPLVTCFQHTGSVFWYTFCFVIAAKVAITFCICTCGVWLPGWATKRGFNSNLKNLEGFCVANLFSLKHLSTRYKAQSLLPFKDVSNISYSRSFNRQGSTHIFMYLSVNVLLMALKGGRASSASSETWGWKSDSGSVWRECLKKKEKKATNLFSSFIKSRVKRPFVLHLVQTYRS